MKKGEGTKILAFQNDYAELKNQQKKLFFGLLP